MFNVCLHLSYLWFTLTHTNAKICWTMAGAREWCKIDSVSFRPAPRDLSNGRRMAWAQIGSSRVYKGYLDLNPESVHKIILKYDKKTRSWREHRLWPVPCDRISYVTCAIVCHVCDLCHVTMTILTCVPSNSFDVSTCCSVYMNESYHPTHVRPGESN